MGLSLKGTPRWIQGLDACIGFVLPLPVFLEPANSFLLATSGAYDRVFAVPISLLALPLAIIIFLIRVKPHVSWSTLIAIGLPSAIFISWSLLIGGISSIVDFAAAAYAIQWILPFLWIPYFAVVLTPVRCRFFFAGFVFGAFTGAAYIATAGFLELGLYGGLQDLGRMSQNLVLYGQGQLYVYTPTVIAYSTLVANWAIKARLCHVSTSFRYVLNVITLFALVFLAAREGLLVFMIGMAALFALGSLRKTLILVAGAAAAGIFGFSLLASGIGENVLGALRIIDKLLALGEEGRALGMRDQMIAQYLNVIRDSPIFGSAMLPPNVFYRDIGVSAPSAHNYYVDVWAWSGLPGLVAVAFLAISAVAISSFRILRTYSVPITHRTNIYFLGGLGICVLLFFGVSNNINVPLRQPLTGPIGLLAAYITIAKSAAWRARVALE